MKEKDHESLWSDYVDLCDNYREKLTVCEFAYLMFSFTAKLCMDCAPTEKEGEEFVVECIQNSLETWEKTDETD